MANHYRPHMFIWTAACSFLTPTTYTFVIYIPFSKSILSVRQTYPIFIFYFSMALSVYVCVCVCYKNMKLNLWSMIKSNVRVIEQSCCCSMVKYSTSTIHTVRIGVACPFFSTCFFLCSRFQWDCVRKCNLSHFGKFSNSIKIWKE